MRHFWIFLHLLGIVMWLGGALGAMAVSIAGRREPRENLAPVARLLATIYRGVILPGSLLAVVSGVALTLIMFGGPGATGAIGHELMGMQGAGLLAAVITLVFLVPNAARLVRLDPVSHAAQFDRARARQARIGMVSGLLGLLALLFGALGRP